MCNQKVIASDNKCDIPIAKEKVSYIIQSHQSHRAFITDAPCLLISFQLQEQQFKNKHLNYQGSISRGL